MASFRFIHCSDLHIDSPFKGFSAIQPEWAQRLHEAPLKSFLNIVDLAVSEQVDAVIIAGDVFDAEDKSLSAQFKFRGGLQTLSDHGIPVFIVHGNHDPLNSWSTTLDWPEGVTVFPATRVHSVPVEKNGRTLAHIYGISFPERDVFDNLALKLNGCRRMASLWGSCTPTWVVTRIMIRTPPARWRTWWRGVWITGRWAIFICARSCAKAIRRSSTAVIRRAVTSRNPDPGAVAW